MLARERLFRSGGTLTATIPPSRAGRTLRAPAAEGSGERANVEASHG
jgi:hypothetical protein